MFKPFIKEACVESLEEAVLAEKLGADRLELCSRLDLDGLTPSFELVETVLKQVQIPVKVMIRPHARDFIYTQEEILKMEEEIHQMKKLDVFGVVFGVLHRDNQVNVALVRQLAEAAKPLNITFHKAIDLCPDVAAATEVLRQSGAIDCILSSGGKPTAIDGAEILRLMIQMAGNMEILVAGRVTSENIDQVHSMIHTRSYHGRRIVGQLES